MRKTCTSRPLILSTALFWLPAFQAAAASEGPPSPQEEIVITGVYARSQHDILQSTTILKAEELQRSLRSTIGDTLLKMPGMSATSFGPGASRPVIRGQQGERVRVLSDGIGSIDASNTSADHAVAGDTLTAERVEVLRGPATLLFGSSGIGGVVNIIDSRIPATLQQDAMKGVLAATYGSAASEWGGGASLNSKITPGLVLHADASYRDTGNMRIGGPRLSSELAAQTGDNRDTDKRRSLENSDLTVKSLGVGATGYTNDGDDFLGFVVSRFLTNYGSPIEEAVRVDLRQTRLDMKGGLTIESGFFDKAKWRFGWADYEHREIEDGNVNTRFLNKGWETRLEFVQRQRGTWRGALGLQYARRDFAAIGEERFVPPNLSHNLGLFTLQEFALSRLKFEGSARYEYAKSESEELALSRTFSTFNAAFGAAYEVNDTLRIGLSVTRAVRAPSAEELFSNGPHIATGVFEIGDPSLRAEKSWNAELNFHAHSDRITVNGAIYRSWFKDFIFERRTGASEDELPVVQYSQANARYYGFELQGKVTAMSRGERSISLDLTADYVNATNTEDATPLPRIPPLRILGGIAYADTFLVARAELEWIQAQNRLAAFELPTRSATTVNASLMLYPLGKASGLTLLLDCNNLFDAEVRRHASFTKDLVPASGRDVRASLRWAF